MQVRKHKSQSGLVLEKQRSQHGSNRYWQVTLMVVEPRAEESESPLHPHSTLEPHTLWAHENPAQTCSWHWGMNLLTASPHLFTCNETQNVSLFPASKNTPGLGCLYMVCHCAVIRKRGLYLLNKHIWKRPTLSQLPFNYPNRAAGLTTCWN